MAEGSARAAGSARPPADVLARAAAATSAPLALAAPDGVVVWANDAFALLCGRPAADLAGVHVDDLPLAVASDPVRDPSGTLTHRALTPAPDEPGHAAAALAVLGRAGESLSAGLDIDDALRRVVGVAVPALADWCALDLIEGDAPLAGTEDGTDAGPDGIGDGIGDGIDGGTDGADRPDVGEHMNGSNGSDGSDRDDPPSDLDVVNEVERRRVRVAVAHRDPGKQHLLWRMAELDGERPGRSVVPQSLVSAEPVLLEALTPDLVQQRTAGSPELAGIFADLDNRAGAVVPLVARGRVIGALTLSTTGESGRPFGRRELAVAEILAARAALAVDNARLFAAETAERRRAAALAEAGMALSASLRTQEILDVLLRLVIPGVGDQALVLLPGDDPDVLRVAASRTADLAGRVRHDALVAGLRVRRGTTGPGAAWASGRTQVHRLSDTGTRTAGMGAQPDMLQVAEGMGITSSVHVPLLAGARCVGVLSVVRCGGAPFSDADARFLTEIGRRGGLALANAGRYESERGAAAELQRALLPSSLPAVPGLQVSGRYLPGGAALVGGDWYDVVPLPDGRVALCVGDVMGRGVRAAAVMGQLRAALRGYAVEGQAPRTVLARLGAFARLLDDEPFATCLFGVHDPQTGRTTLASAGHPPPLVVPADGADPVYADVLPGVPLGVGGDDEPYTDTVVHLAVGDCLLLFTDGLVEGRELPFDDGLGRLAARMAGTRPATADAACTAALRVMGRDHDHEDDTAVLAVRLCATAGAPGRGGDGGSGDDASDDGRRRVRVRLSAQPRSAAMARRHVVGALTRWGAGECTETAALLTSELVGNAVRHGHGPIDLEVADEDGGIFVSVGDASSQAPQARDVVDLDESGRGLLLVEALADGWGWQPRADSGKDVWFRLRRAAEPLAQQAVQNG